MHFFKSKAFVAPLLWACLSGPTLAASAGAPAPDIQLSETSIASKLSDLKGKIVYLDFWASWCGPCKQSFPWMNEMQAKYGAKGLQIVGVNLDAKREDADKFLKEFPAQFAVAFDSKGESAKLFKVKGMPTAFLVGLDGTVINVHQGFRDKDRAELEAKFVSALDAKP